MSIPASVTLYERWTNGQPLSGTTYTAVAPDKPVGHTYSFNLGATLGTDPDAPWSGQYLADLNGNNNITSTVSSATIASTSGRFYIEGEGAPNAGAYLLDVNNTVSNNGRLVVSKSGGGNLNVSVMMDNGNEVGTVDLGTWPSGAWAVEGIYDTQNATAALRVRARTYAVGGSPPSFTNSDGGLFTSAATNEYVSVMVGDDGTESTALKINRIAFSNSTSEDLSALDEGAAAGESLMGQCCL